MYLCRQWLWKTRCWAGQLLQWYLAVLCTHDHDCGAKRKALLIAMISCKMIENSRKFGPHQTCNQTDIYTLYHGVRRQPVRLVPGHGESPLFFAAIMHRTDELWATSNSCCFIIISFFGVQHFSTVKLPERGGWGVVQPIGLQKLYNSTIFLKNFKLPRPF